MTLKLSPSKLTLKRKSFIYFIFLSLFLFCRMSYSGFSPNDRDGHTPVATLGELFIPSGIWGWDCCASVDCVLCKGLEKLQLVDHAA